MGSHSSFGINLHSKPPIPKDTQFAISLSPESLVLSGLNMVAVISTATVNRPPNDLNVMQSAQVVAHFDTGATKTSIDIELAKKLSLIPTGQSPIHTAAGLINAANFVIDLGFPGTSLKPFQNLQISSCQLSDSSRAVQFELLIGRDVMSRWNVVWNEPSSTVFIND